jgi:hypothetical protein
MRTYKRFTSVLAIFVLMLTGAWATAQSGKAADKKAGDSPTPSNEKTTKTTRNMQSAQSNPVFQENQNQGDMPTHGRRDSVVNQDESKSNGGLHNAQSNPIYKDNKMEGKNPLYEGRTVDDNDPSRHHPTENKTPTVQQPANNVSHETVEYKDPEDMTTRTRPGNNKTTKTVSPAGQPSSPTVVEYKDGEDGTSHTRPSKPK